MIYYKVSSVEEMRRLYAQIVDTGIGIEPPDDFYYEAGYDCLISPALSDIDTVGSYYSKHLYGERQEVTLDEFMTFIKLAST